MSSSDTSRISPTANYTSYVWFLNGLSHEALTSPSGRMLHALLAPANLAYHRLLGRPNLDMMLLARHRVIDHLLATEIEAGRVTTVIEIAAGLSPRGFQFARRYRERGLLYIEGDLPDSAARKRRLLDGAGLRGPNHQVTTINALEDDGRDSLAAACADLPAGGGTALITEGLLGYFDLASVEGMWRRFARVLRQRGGGLYLTDLNLGGDASRTAVAFSKLLSWFARGQVHLHFHSREEAERALVDAGFSTAEARLPREFPGVEIPRPEDGHEVRIALAKIESPK